MLQLTPNFDIQGKDPIYIQLYSYIKQEIKKKRLLPEMKLPSKRKLPTKSPTLSTVCDPLLNKGSF